MARGLWKGSISFGLVTIPVELFSAVRNHDVHFHLLSADDHCRLRRKLVCPDDDREVAYKDTVRGFEVAPDQYVIVEKEELEKIKPESGRTIHITDFVELSEVDPIYFERPYFVVPTQEGAHAYALVVAALKQTQRAGVASLTMRDRQYLAVLRPLEDRLGLVTLRYGDEIVPSAELPQRGGKAKLPQRELATAVQLIEALSGEFKPSEYQDEYRERVLKLIESKSRGERPKLPAKRASGGGRVLNIMDALRASLKETKKPAAADQSSKRSRSQRAARRRVS